jgi:putative hydrolase of the HAD superfamily
MKQIKNIIFDLGAVIIDIDLTLTMQAFTDFAPEHKEMIQQNLLKTPFFNDFEKGLINIVEFNEGIKAQLNKEFTHTQIKDAWNALLLTIPQQRIDLLKNIKTQYSTFILSNTNVIHVEEIERIYPLADWVKKVYYSCDMNKRKPDEDIYEQVLHEEQLLAEETLFIDDNLEKQLNLWAFLPFIYR